MSKKDTMDLTDTRTLKEAIKTLSEMKGSYTGSYFDAACASIAALFQLPLSDIEKLASKISK